jgi:cation:H+ antiporter
LIAIELILSLVAILGAAVLFTNAIEILGERLNMGQGAVGSLLAAVGTALPETMIPVVALIGAAIAGGGSEAAGEIGIGAILGAPFLLATLAMFVVGASAYGFRARRRSGTRLTFDRRTARRDIAFFLVFFTIAAGAGIVPLPGVLRVLVIIVLLGAYAFYVYRTLIAGEEAMTRETPQDLTLWPESSFGVAPMWAVLGQVLGSLVVMIAGAHYFVDGVGHVSELLGIPAGLIALVLAPLATELPEKFNSIIWLREDKDTLAFGNIAGAMVFQSTIPVALGIAFTRWELGFLNTFSVILALIAGVMLFIMLRGKKPIEAKPLMFGGVLYGLFVVVALFTLLMG